MKSPFGFLVFIFMIFSNYIGISSGVPAKRAKHIPTYSSNTNERVNDQAQRNNPNYNNRPFEDVPPGFRPRFMPPYRHRNPEPPIITQMSGAEYRRLTERNDPHNNNARPRAETEPTAEGTPGYGHELQEANEHFYNEPLNIPPLQVVPRGFSPGFQAPNQYFHSNPGHQHVDHYSYYPAPQPGTGRDVLNSPDRHFGNHRDPRGPSEGPGSRNQD